MKLHTLLALLAVSAPTLLKAEVVELTTIGGKTYHECRILKIDPDGVLFRHSSGAGKVLFKDMTRSMRDHFGYDAEKAKLREEKVAAERKKTREVAMKQAYEAAKLQQDAINLQAENQALEAMQNAFSQNNSACMTNGWIALSGGLPLGQSYDDGGYVRGDQYGRGLTTRNTMWTHCQSGRRTFGPVEAPEVVWNRLPVAYGRSFSTGCNTNNSLWTYCQSGRRTFGPVEAPEVVWNRLPVAYGRSFSTGCNTNNYGRTSCASFTPRPFFAVPGVGINVAPQTCAPVMQGVHTFVPKCR